MKNLFNQFIKSISEFSKYNLKIKYRKESEAVISNVISKKLDLTKKITAIKILSFNVMMKKIDE